MQTTTINTNQLGTAPIGKLILIYAIPAIIAAVSQSLYNIIDSIFVGHGVGALALSGMAITLPLMNIGSAFGSMVGIGASSLISIRLGQGNKDRAFLILNNAVMMNVVLGLSVSVLGLVFLDPILVFFGASENTLPYARDFMRIILAGNVITHVYMGLNDILRATGYPKKAMFIMLTAVAVNLCLNPLFIFGFGWGIKGSAFATLIAQAVALSIELEHFSNKKNFLFFRRDRFRIMPAIIKKIFSIGLAPLLLNLCSCVVVVFINTALIRTGSDMHVGAYGILNRVVLLFLMVVMGLNQGMQPIVGYNYGARQFDRVIRTLWTTVLFAVCTTTLGFIVTRLFPHQIASIFTTDSTLIAITEEACRIAMFSFPIVGFQIVTSNFFQFIGKPKKAIFLSLTRQLIFLVPLLIILPRTYGSHGVWLSIPIADTSAALLAGIMLFFQLRLWRRHPDRVKII